jgi:hypothetical protein
MLPRSPHIQGLIRPQAITGTCFNALGAVNFSIQLLVEQSVELKTLRGADF